MRSFFGVIKSLGVLSFLTFPGIPDAVASAPDLDANTSAPRQVTGKTQKTTEEMARELSVPLAAFTSLGYGIEYRTYQGSIPGADDQHGWTHIFQPVIPFAQKNGKGFVFRFALPYYPDQPIYWADKGHAEWRIRQEDPTLHEGGYWAPTHGHTDAMTTDLVYGGISETGFILMYGLAGELPTTSDTSNGKQQLILGPELNIGKVTDWGVYGALVSHVIDVAEKKDKGTPDTTITTIQAYFGYDLSNGWQLYSSPTISYDWEGDGGNKLNLPVGGGFAKTTKIGKMPLRVSAEIQKYVASTDRFGPDWLFKLNFIPVFPNKYTRN
jgi:hypothetical protein